MKKNYALLAVTGLMMLSAGGALAAGKDGVAAVVNGKNITVAEIKTAYDANPATKDKVSFNEFYNRTLDLFVDGEVVYQAAEADKITETPEYQKQLKGLKEELARKLYLEKQVRAKVTDKAVKQLYDDYKNSLKGEKEVKAKHILVSSEDTAKEVIAKLNENGQFDKLAKEYSKQPAELGYFSKETMVPEFSQAAFALKKGQYTKTPVKTQFGYHVILVEDIRDAKPEPLKKIEPQLKNMLAQKTMGDIVKGLQNKASIVKYGTDGKEIQ
jgi:peptidyl-prolyl cis-trans isomerase C